MKSGFLSKIILFPICQILTADFESVFIACALVGAADKDAKRLFSPRLHEQFLCDNFFLLA